MAGPQRHFTRSLRFWMTIAILAMKSWCAPEPKPKGTTTRRAAPPPPTSPCVPVFPAGCSSSGLGQLERNQLEREIGDHRRVRHRQRWQGSGEVCSPAARSSVELGLRFTAEVDGAIPLTLCRAAEDNTSMAATLWARGGRPFLPLRGHDDRLIFRRIVTTTRVRLSPVRASPRAFLLALGSTFRLCPQDRMEIPTLQDEQ